MPGSCAAPAIPPVANSGSVISVTTALPPVAVLDLADEARAVDHGIAAVHAVVGALVDLEALVPAVGGADRDARVDGAVLLHPAGRVDLLDLPLLLGLAQLVHRGPELPAWRVALA